MKIVEAINQSRSGPFVIVGRPHSGTRAVTQALLQSGVFSGAEIVDDYLDSEIWFARFVFPLLSDPRMPGLLTDREALAAVMDERLGDTLKYFFRGHDPRSANPWGWKLSETLFFMEELLAIFPGAKFIHLIRDGRDVSLSDGGYFQLTMPPHSARSAMQTLRKFVILASNPHQRFLRNYDYRRFCEYVAFGAHDIKHWQGVDLSDAELIARHRYLIQMQSWVHCVTTARRIGRRLGQAYWELRYEDFCHDPRKEMQRLFEFLGLTPAASTLERVAGLVSSARVGKWQTVSFPSVEEADDFRSAVAHGGDLLAELGYVSP